MKTTFNDITDINEPTASAPVSQNLPAVVSQESAIVGDDFFENEQEVDKDLIRTPRLELTHGVGFGPKVGINPGHLVYNRETILAAPTKTDILDADAVTIYPIKFFTEYEEVVSKEEFEAREGTDTKTLRFRSEAEARKAGFISQKEKKANPAREEPVYHPIMHIMCMVEANKLGHADLALEFEGKKYAVAELILKKGSYWVLGTAIGTHINNCRTFTKKAIWSKGFKIGARFASFKGSKPSWALVDAGRVNPTATFVEWVKQFAS